MTSSRHSQYSRRYDLDWLRVIAFLVLIYFHAAVAFLPDGLPLTINAEPSATLSVLVAFSHNFRLALLFFVSGCGVSFALRHRDKSRFLRERSARLLPPLLFGICVLVPFMVYLEKQYQGESFASFWSFYAAYYTSGVYPEAYLSWHHFWFLAYLYLMCILAWPVVIWMRSEQGKQALNRFAIQWRMHEHGIYYLIVPLLLVEVFLRPLFPGFRDLVQDWASFTHWFLIFLVGAWFAIDPRLSLAAEKWRRTSALLMVMSNALLFILFWRVEEAHLYPFKGAEIDVLAYLLFCSLRISAAWFCILVCVGYAARYLNTPSSVLAALNRAVYPVFCLHLPVLVFLEYHILPLPWSIGSKFFAITSLALVLLIVLYLVLMPMRFIHPMLGFKSKPKY